MHRSTKQGLALALATLFGLLLAGCGDDSKVELYGTTHGNSTLVKLNPNTGELLQTIGPVGYRVNGLAFDPTSGKLYATTSTGDINFPDGLIEINTATGAGSEIGPSTIGLVNNPTINSAGEMFAWTEEEDDLVAVDKTTGAATRVGESDLGTWEHGLAFRLNDRGVRKDTLYFVNGDGEIYIMNTATGASSYVATIGQRAHHGDFHPSSGLYWGIDETASSSALPDRNILVVNIETGEILDTLPTADNLMALAFRQIDD